MTHPKLTYVPERRGPWHKSQYGVYVGELYIGSVFSHHDGRWAQLRARTTWSKAPTFATRDEAAYALYENRRR